MKKKWKNWLKRAGILLLSAAMLAQTAGSFAYAGRGLYRMEELQEVQGEQALKGVEDTKDRKETEERKEKDEQKERKAESVSKEENTSSKNQNQEEDGENEKENGYTRVTESEADDAADKEQQETQSRVTDSEVTESGKEDMSHQEQEQYHFQDGDARSVRKWMELYLPGGYGDIRSREEGWWQNLYDYERELAEFIRDSLVELDPAVYCGQDISEILAVLERGISMDSFFEGTVFQALDPADLYALQSGGWTLDDVYRIYCMYLEENCDWEKLEEEHPQSLLKAAEKLLAGSDRGMEAYSLAAGKLEEGDRAADISVRSTGYSGTGHGTIYKITLGGDPALCMSMGKHARNGYKYFAGEGDYERRNDGIGYLLSYAALSGKFYAVVQIAAWLYLESKSLSRTQVISRAASMVDTSAGEAADMAEMVWEYYQNACRSTNIYYVFRSANSNSQLLGCRYIPSTIPWEPGPGGEEPENPSVEPEFDSVEDSVSVSYQVQVEKKDWQTAVGLAGCVLDIF